MTLTNQNVVEVSQFALKAKKHIGLVKLAEIYTNQNYAVDILIKAVLTGDNELIKLVKSVCMQLNIGIDLIIAVQSYYEGVFTDIQIWIVKHQMTSSCMFSCQSFVRLAHYNQIFTQLLMFR